MRRAPVIVVSIALLLAGCAHKKHARIGAPRAPIEPRVGQTEEGMASWYGHPYHGRQAADGEIYDMEKLVAAHRTLPFHTWVRVYNLDNSKTVDVEIIDRGPFVDGRIIDLSHAAARAVSMIGPGTAKVRIEIIEPPSKPEPTSQPATQPARFAVQVGAWRDKSAAERVKDEMARLYGTAKMVLRSGSPAVWRVLVGDEPSEDGASSLADRIRQDGAQTAFVVRLDI
jgi:rare lipoprotein A